jgi:hypothetical protein
MARSRGWIRSSPVRPHRGGKDFAAAPPDRLRPGERPLPADPASIEEAAIETWADESLRAMPAVEAAENWLAKATPQEPVDEQMTVELARAIVAPRHILDHYDRGGGDLPFVQPVGKPKAAIDQFRRILRYPAYRHGLDKVKP